MMMMSIIVVFYLSYTYRVSDLCLTLDIYYLIYSLQHIGKQGGLHFRDKLAESIYRSHRSQQSSVLNPLNASLVRASLLYKLWTEVLLLVCFLRTVCILMLALSQEKNSVLVIESLNALCCSSLCVFPAAYVGRNVILTSGCIIGACCNLNTFEVIPENTVIYGGDCLRRVQTERPQVLEPPQQVPSFLGLLIFPR